MTLIVETGSIVAGANSFFTLDELRAYALERGVTLSAVDEELEPKVHLAMDWFRYLDHRGALADSAQEVPYPRSNVIIDGVEYAQNEIPPLVIAVVMQASMDAAVLELEPSYAGSGDGRIKKEKLDVMETEFFQGGMTTEQPRLTKLYKMLRPLVSGFYSGRLDVRRV